MVWIFINTDSSPLQYYLLINKLPLYLVCVIEPLPGLVRVVVTAPVGRHHHCNITIRGVNDISRNTNVKSNTVSYPRNFRQTNIWWRVQSCSRIHHYLQSKRCLCGRFIKIEIYPIIVWSKLPTLHQMLTSTSTTNRTLVRTETRTCTHSV